jgi:FtsH-binding integral membrane protein
VAAGVAAALAYLIVIRVFADEAAHGKAFPGWLTFLLGVPFAALVAWITFRQRLRHGDSWIPQVSLRRSRAIGCVWIAAPVSLMAAAAAVPSKYSPPVPVLGMLLIVAFFGFLITTIVGFFIGARWSLQTAFAAAVVGFVIGLAGGLADHDPEPLFAYEVAIFPVVLVLTLVILRQRPQAA